MTDERLQEIDQRAGAATEGPWKAYPTDAQIAQVLDGYAEDWLDAYDDDGHYYEPGIGMSSYLRNPANYFTRHRLAADDSHYPTDADWPEFLATLRFIAAARTDVPELIAEVRRLKAEIARLQGQTC